MIQQQQQQASEEEEKKEPPVVFFFIIIFTSRTKETSIEANFFYKFDYSVKKAILSLLLGLVLNACKARAEGKKGKYTHKSNDTAEYLILNYLNLLDVRRKAQKSVSEERERDEMIIG